MIEASPAQRLYRLVQELLAAKRELALPRQLRSGDFLLDLGYLPEESGPFHPNRRTLQEAELIEATVRELPSEPPQ